MDEEPYKRSFASIRFHGTKLLNKHIREMETELGEDFTQYKSQGLITDDTFHLSTKEVLGHGRLDASSFPRLQTIQDKLNPIQKPIHHLYSDLAQGKEGEQAGVWSLPEIEYRDRLRLVDILLWDLLVQEDIRAGELEQKLETMLDLCRFVMHETPALINASYNYELINKIVDGIYALHAMGRIDEAGALALIHEMEELPLDRCIQHAMRAEFYHAFPRFENMKTTFNNALMDAMYRRAFLPYFRFNQIALAKAYMNSIKNYKKPYFQLGEGMNRQTAFSDLRTLARAYFYSWDHLISKRDVLRTRLELLKLCVQNDARQISSVADLAGFGEDAAKMDPITGKLLRLTILRKAKVIHSAAIMGKAGVRDEMVLFQDTYGIPDLQMVLIER